MGDIEKNIARGNKEKLKRKGFAARLFFDYFLFSGFSHYLSSFVEINEMFNIYFNIVKFKVFLFTKIF